MAKSKLGPRTRITKDGLHINVIVKPLVHARLVQIAEQQQRSLSSVVRIILEDHVKQSSVEKATKE